MLSRISFIKIIVGHFSTLKRIDCSSKYIYWKDALLHIVFPVVLSFSLVALGLGLKTMVTNLIASIAILAGFLFNLLAIIYNVLSEIRKQSQSSTAIKRIYANQIHANISFNILVGLFSIISLLIYSADFPNTYISIKGYDLYIFHYVELIILSLSYCFILSFLLTFLMVLNRVYILLDREK